MTVLDPTGDVDLAVENERLRRRVEQLESYLAGMVDIGLIALASAQAGQAMIQLPSSSGPQSSPPA